MNWRITSINNLTHEVTLCHEDGEVMHLIVPIEETLVAGAKDLYIKAQTDARDAAKALEIGIEILKPVGVEIESKVLNLKSRLMVAAMIVEAIVIAILLLRH